MLLQPKTAMKAKIEWNRQRALMLRQAQLASGLLAGEGGGTSAKVAKKQTLEEGSSLKKRRDRRSKGQRKWCFNQVCAFIVNQKCQGEVFIFVA